jgi:3-phenylpropionate/trans-cinnamate dioxygenase ferredoxin subunit
MRYAVGTVEELPPGARKIVNFGRGEIGVLNVNGAYHALRNVCPHRGAPLCLGTVGGTMLPSPPGTYRYGLEDTLLRCPWHRWEYSLETGRAWHDPRLRVRVYPVTVEDGTIYVEA